jgi:hypothetical protein
LNYEEFKKTLSKGKIEALDIGGKEIEIDTSDFKKMSYKKMFDDIHEAMQGEKIKRK